MNQPCLVIMAAGMGSRFGGPKQTTPVDEYGHFLLHYSLFDAYRAGFRKVVFVVKEETAEVEAEIRSGDQARLEEEFGDLFFALINACRLYGIDPESALERTNKKFIRRFNYMEEHAAAEGRMLHDMTLDEMETLWQQAKKEE